MLTSKILSCYNHLVATSMLYLTIVDPFQEITRNLATSNHDHQSRSPSAAYSFVGATETNSAQDYYEILGVNKDATKHDIHKAFRQLAKKYHPDKNKDKGAQDEFIKIFKAYETLSDEKKRKEYDEQSKSNDYGTFRSWQTDNMHDFDVNEFFKQYEEQLFKHAQNFDHHNHDQHHHDIHQNHHHHHHQHHNQQHDHLHQQFMFHGVNLDDLFHDIDEDEFSSINHVFSDHHNNINHIHSEIDGTFGDGASFFGTHFPSQIHNTLHQYQHQQGIHDTGKNSYSCQTITKQVNGMMMTQTSCG